MHSHRICSFIALVLATGSAIAYSQSTATLSGTITDPSGAVVPQAQVTVHGLSTGVDRTAASDPAGSYTIPSLQPGNYSVSVRAAGFADYKLASVTLQVDQNVTANVKLGVASAGQVVQVQAAALLTPAIPQRSVSRMSTICSRPNTQRSRFTRSGSRCMTSCIRIL